ncbi:hypothetical protein LDENG_00283780 [Lucifuga dentata]|nr:hypothetical protein LDENG_00283780 [Lucifuga dentata]
MNRNDSPEYLLSRCITDALWEYGNHTLNLKDHTTHFACLSLIYKIFKHVTLLTIISQSILLEW